MRDERLDIRSVSVEANTCVLPASVSERSDARWIPAVAEQSSTAVHSPISSSTAKPDTNPTLLLLSHGLCLKLEFLTLGLTRVEQNALTEMNLEPIGSCLMKIWLHRFVLMQICRNVEFVSRAADLTSESDLPVHCNNSCNSKVLIQ